MPFEAGSRSFYSAIFESAGPSKAIDLDAVIIRIFDFALSFAALIFLLPALVAVAALVKLQDGGEVFFAHSRIGKGMHEFKCLKFRSMHVRAEILMAELLAQHSEARAEWEVNHKLRHDPRVTPLGKFLRKTSLDELPQLFNVLLDK